MSSFEDWLWQRRKERREYFHARLKDKYPWWSGHGCPGKGINPDCGKIPRRGRGHGHAIWCIGDCKNACEKKRKALLRSDTICKSCGTAFKGTRTDAKYCSSKCRQQAYRQRQNVTAKLRR
jgi:hypothetical protein